MKVKKPSFNAISKRIGCLFFALLMMISLAAPAFAAVNVEGEGGTSSLQGVSGACTYNNADSMWKVSLYYSRYDTNTTDTSNLGNTGKWKQYGETFYVYHPTANRGASGKINLNFFKNAIYLLATEKQSNGTYKSFAGNKPYFLAKSSSNIANVSATITPYNEKYIRFLSDTKSPAIAMNGYTIDAVKEYFESGDTLQRFITFAYKTVGSSVADGFGNTTFSIDGMNGNYVDKTANSGKSATTGYTWSTATKHLTFNDWYKGIKTDYKGKQIYIHPKIDSNGTFLNGVGWVIVYEPVLCVEPKTTLKINGTTYKYVCCTPTEFAILQQHGVINIGTLASSVFGHLSNSTVLDKTWFGYSVPSGKFSATSSTMTTDLLNKIYKQAGWGMTIFDPYNYVIKDYEMKISVPKTAKTGEAFSVKYYATNKSKDNNGDTGNTNNPLTVNFVWVARVYNGTNEYWFDLWNLRNKTLTTSNALKNGSTLVTSYNEAAKIVEARRSSEDGKPKYKISAKTQNKWEDYTYTLDSAFSGYTFEVRACVNTDTDGNNAFAKKELNSGAYYKSGEIKK